MYEDIDAPANFIEKRNKKAAEVVMLLKQLNDIPYEKGFKLLLSSSFGWKLKNETTKAWFHPEYWAYRIVCDEHNIEGKEPLVWYDRADIPMLMEMAGKEARNRGWD